MQNPFLTPPQVESAQSRSWALGFMFGYQGPARSTLTPVDIQPEDQDAFDEGVPVGEEAAISGVPVSKACVDLNAEGGVGPHLLLETPELVFWIKDLAHGLAGGVAGSVVFFINLSIALETFTDNPDEKLAEAAAALQTQMQQIGFDQSLQLFIGGGVDTSVAGCELMLTPIFQSQDAATTAAKAFGRPHWLVVSWRTDQSGGAKVVDSSS